MDRERYLAALGADSAALHAVTRETGPDARVPSCPDWSVADLVWHVARVHGFWAAIVRQRPAGPESLAEPVRPGSFEEVLAIGEHNAAGLEAVLAATDPAAQVWTWSRDRSAGFVARRMALETTVHRLDGELAAGRTPTLDPELASDGVDEFLTHFLPARRGAGSEPVGGSVHLHCTDVAGEWLVREEGDNFAVTREHAKGDAAIRGPAGVLLQVLWRRLPLDSADVVGDRGVAARLVGHTALG